MRLLHILLICLLLTSAAFAQEQWYFSVDERYPAERTQLQDQQRILVVNNALPQPLDFGHTTMVDGNNSGKVEVDLHRSVLYCLFSTTQTMEYSGEYDAVELMDKSQNPTTNYYARQMLSHAQAEQLCADYDADALLILNQLVLYDVMESFLTENGTYYAYLQAYAQSHWTIHYAGQMRDYSFNQSDTLLWESQPHYSRVQCLSELPAREDALLYLARELGNRLGSTFAPSWRSSRRYIYDLDALEEGLEAFRYQRWEEAIGCWQLVIGKGQLAMGKGDKKTAACAAANIAIAYEMKGDYASACDYARRAIRLFGAWKTAYGRQQQANIRYYLAQLQARMAMEGAQ